LDDHQKNHQCSLLCQCDCCSHVTVFNMVFHSLSPIDHNSEYTSTYSETYHFEIIRNIWQPPRQLRAA
jgi:hypothetical protein